jgi:hypothetical protein
MPGDIGQMPPAPVRYHCLPSAYQLYLADAMTVRGLP